MADTTVAFPQYGVSGGQVIPIKAIDNGGGTYSLAVSVAGTAVTSVNGSTGAITLLPPDTGWTANADSGDKTVVIGSTATLDTIATALNIVTAGAGTQLENIAQKVKALEAAFVANKRPNA